MASALRLERGKTGRLVEIELVGELGALVDQHLADHVVFPAFVHRHGGRPFTVDSVGVMFRRYCCSGKANVQDSGPRDLRASGTTEWVRRGVDLSGVRKVKRDAMPGGMHVLRSRMS